MITARRIVIRKSSIADLEKLFVFQLDEEANYMASFTSKDPTDKKAYLEKWTKLLIDKTINMQTIICNGDIVGSVVKYEVGGVPEITYWIGKAFWRRGIATKALQEFLMIEKARPIFGRVAFDNFGSQKVLEKCGFQKISIGKGFANARGVEIEEIIFKLT